MFPAQNRLDFTIQASAIVFLPTCVLNHHGTHRYYLTQQVTNK